MKVLVVLCAVVASCLAKPYSGYAYSAISPLTGYSSYAAAPYSYAYSAPIISGAYAGPYAGPYAAPAPYAAPIVHAPAVGVKTQHHSQNEAGEASYGHSEPLQHHEAIQDAHGNKIGSYSYVDPHGAVHKTDYVADSLGYRVQANDLPLAPASPAIDTPEVAAAKAAHFAAHASPLVHYRRRRNAYYGPYAPVVITPSGHLADTPEVAAAKAAHFAEHAKVSGHYAPAPYAGHYAGHYAGPYATPVVTPSGHLADTPEVAAAKAAHFAEHAKASGHYAPALPYAAPHYTGNYHGYAAPVVTPSGFLADTPEVAAAKSAHLHEHALRGKRSVFYQTPASTSPIFSAPAPVAYAAPIAHPAPLAYTAPIAHPAPLAYAAPAHGIPAIKTEIVHNPGHAFSYRVDSLAPHYY